MNRREPKWFGVAVLPCWGLMAVMATTSVSAQTLNFALVGSIAGSADMVRTQGAYAYLAAGKTLTIVDISNPAEAKRTGAYTFPEQIWGFRVAGSSVYVAADLFGLGILDVSNAAAPTLRGSFKTPGQAKNVAISGTTALVADHVSGLDIVDVSNPSKPMQAGSVFLEGFATDVVTSGSLAYAADRPTGFYTLDLSKPRPLEPTGVQSATSPGLAQLEVLPASAQHPALAVLVANGLLQMYDVSNPAAPIKIPAYRTPGGARRVALKGRLAYVADGQEGLQIVDLSTPSKPSIVGAYKTASPARDVAVADSFVFVVVGSEVLILRQTP
jgi:hypothetical protein